MKQEHERNYINTLVSTNGTRTTNLDIHKDDTPDSGGWLEIFDKGALLTLNAKTGWREVEVGRGSSDQTCPVRALEQWLHFAKIDFGPVFVRTSRDGKRALEARLSDKHVARLVKAAVLKSGVRSDLPEAKRLAMFSGHSLRAGLASSAGGRLMSAIFKNNSDMRRPR
jgi:hypothetical protein